MLPPSSLLPGLSIDQRVREPNDAVHIENPRRREVEKSGEWVWGINGWHIAHSPRRNLSHLGTSSRPLTSLLQSTCLAQERLLEGKGGIKVLSVSQCKTLGLAHRRDLIMLEGKKEGEKRERGRRQEIMTQPEITGTQ